MRKLSLNFTRKQTYFKAYMNQIIIENIIDHRRGSVQINK